MATLRFLGSNSLRFTWDQDPNLPNDFNRQYGDIDYFNKYHIPYYQKVNQSDDTWFQFRTDYSIFDIQLVNKKTGATSPLSEIAVGQTTDLTKTYYNVTVPTSGLDGCYYVTLLANKDTGKPIVSFTSNIFEVMESHDNTILIEWANNIAYDDGFLWSDRTQELRLNAQLVEDEGGAAVASYIDDNNNNELLSYFPEYAQTLQCEELPRDMTHLLNRIVGHNVLAINNIEYTVEGAFDFGERFGYSRLYAPSISVKVKNYENYSEDEELTGDLPIIPASGIMAAPGVSIMAVPGTGIKAT